MGGVRKGSSDRGTWEHRAWKVLWEKPRREKAAMPGLQASGSTGTAGHREATAPVSPLHLELCSKARPSSGVAQRTFLVL